jgi:hypothetical protein
MEAEDATHPARLFDEPPGLDHRRAGQALAVLDAGAVVLRILDGSAGFHHFFEFIMQKQSNMNLRKKNNKVKA